MRRAEESLKKLLPLPFVVGIFQLSLCSVVGLVFSLFLFSRRCLSTTQPTWFAEPLTAMVENAQDVRHSI